MAHRQFVRKWLFAFFLLLALLPSICRAQRRNYKQIVKRGEIDPDNDDFVGPVIYGCPDNVHAFIPKCEETTETVVTWDEPTAVDAESKAYLFEQNYRSGDSFPLSENNVVVYYDFIDDAGNIESCQFYVNVTREVSNKECVPDCIIANGKTIPSRATFITSDCSQKCTCVAGFLVCEDYGCTITQHCRRNRKQTYNCQCKKNYVRDTKTTDCYRKCPAGFVPFMTSCYEFHPEKKNFRQARKTCRKTKKTDLATISSDPENDFVYRLLNPSTTAWLGAKSHEHWAFELRTHKLVYSFVKELNVGNHRVEFYVQADNEIKLLLSKNPSNKGQIYEIIFKTSEVSLRLCKTCDAVMTSPLPVNISFSGASFFVTFRDGTIMIGESGKVPFTSWVHRARIPLNVAYVGIASKAVANWHFYERFTWMRKAESWNYENWSNNEPNTYDERRSCAVMKGNCGGQWSDSCCSFQKSFVCEQN